MASKMAEMRRGVGKEDFILDPDLLGTHSKKKRTTSKMEIIIINGLCCRLSEARAQTRNSNMQCLQGYHKEYVEKHR